MTKSESPEIRPVIGLPCLRMLQPNGSYRHAISSTYINALVNAGAAPLLIPSTASEEAIYSIYKLLDGLLLTGGDDIDPALYNEGMDGSEDIDRMRDATEIMITRWAMEDKLPVLGICRGQQLLNVAMGGSLYQDIPSQLPETNLNHRESALRQQRDYIAHPVKLQAESRLAKMLGVTELQANTLHHQSVKQPGKGLRVAGIAPDGVVEALESDEADRWVFAVQCHPEELWQQHGWANKLFGEFVAATARRRERAGK